MQNTHYEQLGGEKPVRELVDRFYDLMDADKNVSELRALHAKSLKGSRNKLFMFLCGWLGGPQLYVEKYGHPRLRQRHLPFKIGELERDQWMQCIDQAMSDMKLNTELRQTLYDAFYKTADFMRNQ
jgi:hemoglobin